MHDPRLIYSGIGEWRTGQDSRRPACRLRRSNASITKWPKPSPRAIREKLTAQLMEPIPDTPAQFRARIDADLARWTPVIEAANIKIN